MPLAGARTLLVRGSTLALLLGPAGDRSEPFGGGSSARLALEFLLADEGIRAPTASFPGWETCPDNRPTKGCLTTAEVCCRAVTACSALARIDKGSWVRSFVLPHMIIAKRILLWAESELFRDGGSISPRGGFRPRPEACIVTQSCPRMPESISNPKSNRCRRNADACVRAPLPSRVPTQAPAATRRTPSGKDPRTSARQPAAHLLGSCRRRDGQHSEETP
jgi:hypothetical protein